MGETCPICEERYTEFYESSLWLQCWRCWRSVHRGCVTAKHSHQAVDPVFFVCQECEASKFQSSILEAKAVRMFRAFMNSIPDDQPKNNEAKKGQSPNSAEKTPRSHFPSDGTTEDSNYGRKQKTEVLKKQKGKEVQKTRHVRYTDQGKQDSVLKVYKRKGSLTKEQSLT